MLDYASNRAMLDARLIGFQGNLKVGTGSHVHVLSQHCTENMCTDNIHEAWMPNLIWCLFVCRKLRAGELLMSFDFQVFHEKSVQTAFSRFRIYIYLTHDDANPYIHSMN